MNLVERLNELRKTIPVNVKLVAVSKNVPVEMIRQAYDAGQRDFGENKAQEIRDKYPLCPPDICWHFIGHLQSNKVKYIAGFIDTIHSVDGLKLLEEIDRQATRYNRIIKCLLQFHIAREETKFGLDMAEAVQLLSDPAFKNLNHVQIVGVMGMATLTENKALIREEFISLRNIYRNLKEEYFKEDGSFSELSMGMTSDYEIAVEEGSTMVRLGTAIFR